MKILQISNRVPWPLNEGGNIGIYNYTRVFSELGHEVTFYCLDAKKHKTPLKEAQQELSKFCKLHIRAIDTSIKPFAAFMALVQNRSYNVARFYKSEFENDIADLLSKKQFDIVQMEGTFTGPYVAIVKKYHEGLLSLRMHNVEFEIWQRLSSNASSYFKKKYLSILSKQLKQYETTLLENFDVVVTVTDDDQRKFKELNAKPTYLTIPAGVDLNIWKFDPSKNTNLFYHIGSMEWHANKEAVNWFLSEVHPKLIKLSPSYQLNLAGKGISEDEYSGISQLKIFPIVKDAYEFVKQQNVCVVPLKSGSGIRIKILEAMAAGKLVISTTIGAQGIEYTNREHLLIADTSDQFAELYKQLESGTIEIEPIISNARKLIEEKYSTVALTENLVNFYKKEGERKR